MNSQFFYGCAFADNYLLRSTASLPLYGHLARKVMMHYLGDRYNPHLHGLAHEHFLRLMIKQFVAYKVFNRLSSYDWEWLDQSFRKYFSGSFGIDLPFDNDRIKAGLKEPSRTTTQPANTVH